MLCVTRLNVPGCADIVAQAVHTVFNLAKDPPQIAHWLLSILEDPHANSEAKLAVGDLLPFVADEPTVLRLLKQLKSNWERGDDISPQSRALIELGRMEYVTWIESVLGTLPADDRRRPVLESNAELIRLQHDPDAILARIETTDWRFDKGWFVRHAMRHGVDPGKVHSAARVALMRAKVGNPSTLGPQSLARTLSLYGLWDEADAAEFAQLVGHSDIVRQEHGASTPESELGARFFKMKETQVPR